MPENSRIYPVYDHEIHSGGALRVATDGTGVAKEDRKFRVLAFLVDTRLALPRKVIYRNLAYQGIDFSESSLKNYLGELRKEGFVERIDANALEKQKVAVSNDDPGYWLATTRGFDRVKSHRKDQRDEIDTSHL